MRLKVPTRGLAVAIVVTSMLLVAAACNRTEPARDTAVTPGAQQPAQPRDDRQVSTDVQARFYNDETTRMRTIDVSAQDGVVTLRGTVPDESTKERAVALARDVQGVSQVNDELQVRSDAEMAASREPGATPVPAATPSDDERQPGWITTKIQAQYFVNPEIKPWNIDVTTASDGVVTLEGTVDSEQDRTEAVRIARETDGVARVEDRLRVGADADRAASADRAANVSDSPDAWVTAKIQAKYFVDTDVKGRRIDVDTQNGVVTLRGDVGSELERRQAVALAQNTDGVREVQDQLRVDAALRDRDAPLADRERAGTVVERPDGWITTKIQAQYYLDPDVKGFRINVDTRDGVVTLKGTVDTAEQKTEAEQIARETEGVRRVVNQLTVETTTRQ